MTWKWTGNKKTVTLPVGFCRDKEIWDTSLINNVRDTDTNKGGWQWAGEDDRVFLVPTGIVECLPINGSLTRDVVAYLTSRYLTDRQPVIVTSCRQIANHIGISINGARAEAINNALIYARVLTVKNQLVHTEERKRSTVTTTTRKTFGFVESVESVDVQIELKSGEVKTRPQKLKVALNQNYVEMLNTALPKAPVPVAALETANKLPRKLIVPTKNIVYHLAARVPMTEVDYSLVKLSSILGYRQDREERLRKSIENVFNKLTTTMIRDYDYDDQRRKYRIILAGEKCDPIRQIV